ncbi:MAG: hypothetical protein Q8P86_04090 [bacterium]|nr:hypothetical protein [bacterium]
MAEQPKKRKVMAKKESRSNDHSKGNGGHTDNSIQNDWFCQPRNGGGLKLTPKGAKKFIGAPAPGNFCPPGWTKIC